MIRAATILDTQNILQLVEQFYPNTSYSKWAAFDSTTVTLLCDTLRKRGILLVAEEAGQLVGIIGFIGTPFIFNREVISGHEVIWWVLPTHQKSGVGIELLRRADELRQLKGWRSLQMMRLSTSPAHLDKVLEAEGFLPSEYCFTKVD